MVRTKSGIALAPGLYKPRPPDGMPPWAMNKEWDGRDVERPRSCLKKLEIRWLWFLLDLLLPLVLAAGGCCCCCCWWWGCTMVDCLGEVVPEDRSLLFFLPNIMLIVLEGVCVFTVQI